MSGKAIMCDFRSVDLANESIDVIITDPPYAVTKENLALYEALADFAARVLKPHGHLFTLVGHSQLPFVIHSLSKRLKYRWLLIYLNENPPHAQMNLVGVQVHFKPILWFVKDSWKAKGFFSDTIISQKAEKGLHPWQQNEIYYEHILKNKYIIPPGGVVCDPMAGSYTVARVADRLGIDWIACDISTDIPASACEKISNQKLPS